MGIFARFNIGGSCAPPLSPGGDTCGFSCGEVVHLCVSGRSRVNTFTTRSGEHTRVWSAMLVCSRLIKSLSLVVGGLHSVKFCQLQLSILHPMTRLVCHHS